MYVSIDQAGYDRSPSCVYAPGIASTRHIRARSDGYYMPAAESKSVGIGERPIHSIDAGIFNYCSNLFAACALHTFLLHKGGQPIISRVTTGRGTLYAITA